MLNATFDKQCGAAKERKNERLVGHLDGGRRYITLLNGKRCISRSYLVTLVYSSFQSTISYQVEFTFYIVSSVFLVDRLVLKMDGSTEDVGKSSPLVSSPFDSSISILAPLESCRSKCGAIRFMICCEMQIECQLQSPAKKSFLGVKLFQSRRVVTPPRKISYAGILYNY